MTFYGKPPDPPKAGRGLRDFRFRLEGDVQPRQVRAHAVYFYPDGFVGFWTDDDAGDAGRLELAVKPIDVWEEDPQDGSC